MKMDEEPVIGKGISLTDEEVDTMVDKLVDIGFGSIDVLQSAINKRKSQYGGVQLR